ncbi:hypothetical protein I3J27_33115 [Bradyrhizobium xenonodulans]|uniref:Uncharacterized protein n=1 Tax=Bradyrhizobium xenonodulans TaxID=2736875 RepID=A0ABY7MJP2_9BRAD|nr:hypothetical protein [Bradyrhizobium xenonodulans]WBL77799.1 hypothetical protein I3J27_33115 [Bradyrhizobium xenonodulans]
MNDQKWAEILRVFGPAGARTLRDLKAEIDGEGDITSLTVEPEDVEYFGTKMSLPAATIRFEKPRFGEPLADLIAYQQCMEQIVSRRTFVHRLFSLADSEEANKIANPEIYVSLFDLSGREIVESMAIHYRKIFELMIYACWTAFEPRMKMSYEANQLKNIHQCLRDKFPAVHTFMVPMFANSFEPIPPDKREGFDFDELLEAYGFSSKIVHETGPYRRPFDVILALHKFVEWNSRLLTVLALHRIQISSSEFVFCRCRGDGKVFVWIDGNKPIVVPRGALETATQQAL